MPSHERNALQMQAQAARTSHDAIEVELQSALSSQNPEQRRVALGHLLILMVRDLKPALDAEEREHQTTRPPENS